jgi:hypothetical protein
VHAGDLELERPEGLALGQQDRGAAELVEGEIAGREVRLGGEAVGDDAALDLGDDALQVGVVEAQDDRAIERDLVGKVDERLLEVVDAPVLVEVLPCDPATATPYFILMSSASISARGMTGMRPVRALRTSTLSSRTAEEMTTTSASLRFSARWPMATSAPRRTSRRVASFSWMSEPETL